MADEHEPSGEAPDLHESDPVDDGKPRLPSNSIWPAGFAAGIALVLVGLIISWPVVAVGAGISIVLGFLWARDVTREVRRPEPEPEPAPEVHELEEEPGEEDGRYTRNRFLEGATLGFGAAIGAAVTIPALGFAIAPVFVGQERDDINLGPLENFPDGEFVIVTFESDLLEGPVSDRTAYVRNNGVADGTLSMTVISNRCVHLGCPVQPNGPSGDAAVVNTSWGTAVLVTPTQPSGYTCPCHGGAYDIEGNRTAGPPVRALDRYRFSLVDGEVILQNPYSVGKVEGEGSEALIEAYKLADPGVHVDGFEQIFYPFVT